MPNRLVSRSSAFCAAAALAALSWGASSAEAASAVRASAAGNGAIRARAAGVSSVPRPSGTNRGASYRGLGLSRAVAADAGLQSAVTAGAGAAHSKGLEGRLKEASGLSARPGGQVSAAAHAAVAVGKAASGVMSARDRAALLEGAVLFDNARSLADAKMVAAGAAGGQGFRALAARESSALSLRARPSVEESSRGTALRSYGSRLAVAALGLAGLPLAASAEGIHPFTLMQNFDEATAAGYWGVPGLAIGLFIAAFLSTFFAIALVVDAANGRDKDKSFYGVAAVIAGVALLMNAAAFLVAVPGPAVPPVMALLSVIGLAITLYQRNRGKSARPLDVITGVSWTLLAVMGAALLLTPMPFFAAVYTGWAAAFMGAMGVAMLIGDKKRG